VQKRHVLVCDDSLCPRNLPDVSGQKRHVLVCEDSLCPKKLPDVSGSGLREAGRYTFNLKIPPNFLFLNHKK